MNASLRPPSITRSGYKNGAICRHCGTRQPFLLLPMRGRILRPYFSPITKVKSLGNKQNFSLDAWQPLPEVVVVSAI